MRGLRVVTNCVSVFCILLCFAPAGCGLGQPTVSDLTRHLQSSGYEVNRVYDFASRPATAGVNKEMGGRVYSVQANSLTFKVVEAPDKKSAKVIAEKFGAKPRSKDLIEEAEGDLNREQAFVNGALVLFVKETAVFTRTGQKLIKDFQSFNR